ncbi:hypothetical protein COV11_04945 [Candidatus Woesearchaeota archaeon CG10_big_fil_rev_8_21_14_0_10_30_7]|nr:MAG: hypothetical protein COV11_04945 [Candidatus Woesearchaeota archaeon CG10_big_fil_rev_8_21_14_0_10_30_7]
MVKKGNEFLELLTILIENKEDFFSIKKLSEIRKINYKSAYEALKKLEKEGIIDLKKIGNTISCSFNNKFNTTVFIAEHERRAKLLKKSDFRIIFNRLNELKFPFIVLLFGSQVKNKQTKHSDFDLLIISHDEEEIKRVFLTLPLKTHLTYLTPKEFVSMTKSKEFSVVSEVMKKNIILIGIEDYYRLINNVK